MVFHQKAPKLRQIVQHLQEAYLRHFFRYERPDQMPLPDIEQVIEMFAVRDEEFEAVFGLQK